MSLLFGCMCWHVNPHGPALQMFHNWLFSPKEFNRMITVSLAIIILLLMTVERFIHARLLEIWSHILIVLFMLDAVIILISSMWTQNLVKFILLSWPSLLMISGRAKTETPITLTPKPLVFKSANWLIQIVSLRTRWIMKICSLFW